MIYMYIYIYIYTYANYTPFKTHYTATKNESVTWLMARWRDEVSEAWQKFKDSSGSKTPATDRR
jgi:hypothetical protein